MDGTTMKPHHHIAEQTMDRIANAGAATSGVLAVIGAWLGTNIDHINKFLQAGAFIGSIIVAGAATAYYLHKINREDKDE